MKLSIKVLLTVLITGIAMAQVSQEDGSARFLGEKNDSPSMAKGLSRTVGKGPEEDSLKHIEADGFARKLALMGSVAFSWSWFGGFVAIFVVSCCCLALVYAVGKSYISLLQACCGIDGILMLVMLAFGAAFLADAFTCDKCLYFAAGTEGRSSYSVHQSQSNESISVFATGYTGTVGNAIGQMLGSNAKNYIASSSFVENCGIWIFHPDEWKKLGQTIEVDTAVGQGNFQAGQKVWLSLDSGLQVQPLSSKHSRSECGVNIGTDNKLRNYKDGQKVIGDGTCKVVQYLDIDQAKDTPTFAVETVVIKRKVYAILGLVIFVLIHSLRYVSIFMKLVSDANEDNAAQINAVSCNELKEKIKEKLKNVYEGIKQKYKKGERCTSAFDWIFYSQFPMFVLEPLLGSNFIEGCDGVLAFRFNPEMWVAAVGFASVGLLARCVESCFDCMNAPRSKGEEAGRKEESNQETEGGNHGLAYWFVFCLMFVDCVLILYVLFHKGVNAFRFGFTMIFNVKLEWVFQFPSWPLTIAVDQDMFQFFAFLFAFFDPLFGICCNYYMNFADKDERKRAAGTLGRCLKGCKKKAARCLKGCKKKAARTLEYLRGYPQQTEVTTFRD